MTDLQTKTEMTTAAETAAEDYLQTHLNGQDNYPCGFAWVTLRSSHKGNTRAGRDDIQRFRALGARKGWRGHPWIIWNPGNYAGQNVDATLAGARAAADVLTTNGFQASAGSRWDYRNGGMGGHDFFFGYSRNRGLDNLFRQTIWLPQSVSNLLSASFFASTASGVFGESSTTFLNE